jgi:hypothetical protein
MTRPTRENLTESDWRALRALAWLTGEISASALGFLLWPEEIAQSPSVTPVARRAGRVLNRLRKHGLATHVITLETARRPKSWGWKATRRGRALAAKTPAA